MPTRRRWRWTGARRNFLQSNEHRQGPTAKTSHPCLLLLLLTLWTSHPPRPPRRSWCATRAQYVHCAGPGIPSRNILSDLVGGTLSHTPPQRLRWRWRLATTAVTNQRQVLTVQSCRQSSLPRMGRSGLQQERLKLGQQRPRSEQPRLNSWRRESKRQSQMTKKSSWRPASSSRRRSVMQQER